MDWYCENCHTPNEDLAEYCLNCGADQPPETCNGICLTGYDVGVPYPGIAYAHPDCYLHGSPEPWHDSQ